MLTSLLKRLSGESAVGGPLARDETRVAIATLLVITAHADHRYDEAEQAQIDRVLQMRYGLDAAGAAALRAEGEALESAATDLYRFTTLIKAGVPHEERTSVLEALWRIVLADRQREMHEEALLRRLTDLLGLDSRDSVEARRRAEAGAS